MIKDNQKMFNRIHIVLDACVIVIAYLLTYFLRFESFLNHFSFFRIGINDGHYSIQDYAERLIFLVPSYLFIYYFSHLYTPKRGKRRWTEIVNITVSNFFGIMFFASFLYITKEADISRKFLGLFFCIKYHNECCRQNGTLTNS